MVGIATYRADLELVRDVLNEREGSLARFSRRMQCVPRILAAQNARLGRPLDEHDLLDLQQDVLVLVWTKLGTFEGRAPLEGWVYRLCCLELMNNVRRKNRRMRLTEDVPGAGAGTDSASWDGDPWQYEDVHRGLERLGDPAAAIIRLKHFDGRTFTEIARLLDVSPNTAKTWYYRGLTALQDFIDDHEGGGS